MKRYLRMTRWNEILAPASESRAQFLIIAIKNVAFVGGSGEREKVFVKSASPVETSNISSETVSLPGGDRLSDDV